MKHRWAVAAGLLLVATPELAAQESQGQADQQEAKEIVIRIRKSMREM